MKNTTLLDIKPNCKWRSREWINIGDSEYGHIILKNTEMVCK